MILEERERSLKQDTKALTIKEKIAKLDYITMISSKDTTAKVRKQPTNWENTFTIHIKSKVLSSSLYILLINKEKTGKSKEKQARKLNRKFIQEDMQVANTHMQNCLISLAVRGMQIHTSLNHYYTSSRMVKI